VTRLTRLALRADGSGAFDLAEVPTPVPEHGSRLLVMAGLDFVGAASWRSRLA
jgi:hypothetical protein